MTRWRVRRDASNNIWRVPSSGFRGRDRKVREKGGGWMTLFSIQNKQQLSKCLAPSSWFVIRRQWHACKKTVRKEKWDLRSKTGDVRFQKDLRQETWGWRHETGYDYERQEMWGRRHETGDMRQETGDRRQKTEDRRQKTEDKGRETGNG